jgi:septum site-determining protein MinD
LSDVQEILRIDLLGVIPESATVLEASNQGIPVIHMKGTDVSGAYSDVVERFLGQNIPMRFINGRRPNFFKRMFGGR